MTILSLTLAPMLFLQAAGEAPMAIANENPDTWSVEYPRAIQPYVEDYRRCLNIQMRRVTGIADFEMQHRDDIVTCEDVAEEAQESAERTLRNRAEFAEFTDSDVRDIFEHIARIHVARGADLDSQFTYIRRRYQASLDQYEAEKPEGLVLELHDASVVKARTDATAAAAEAAYQEREARGVND